MATDGQGSMAAKRALGAVIVIVPMVFGLSACSEKVLDKGLLGSVTGDPSPVSDNPSPIREMSGERKDYPNLGTVPARPAHLTTEADRRKEMDRLAEDRAASRRTRQETESIQVPAPLPTPMAVPPPPNLTPGRS